MLPGLQTQFLCIASFSTDGDLLSQWRGYAATGGVSLSFHKSALEAAAKQEGFTLQQCVYDTLEKIKLITDYLNMMLKDIENPSNASDAAIWTLAEGWVFAFQIYASSFKHNSFVEENEWRLVSGIIAEYGARVAVRPGPGLPIPYFDLPLQQAVVRGQADIGLDAIMVGPHRDQELAMKAFDIAAATNNVRVAPAIRSSIPYRSV
jgi:hypothetical protein